LLGANGEAEGDEVNKEDGGQHRGGAGHGGRSVAQSEGYNKFCSKREVHLLPLLSTSLMYDYNLYKTL
jgi:hypothetical protein